jgi:hypothetical protein
MCGELSISTDSRRGEPETSGENVPSGETETSAWTSGDLHMLACFAVGKKGTSDVCKEIGNI